jgi:hypothetical protein
MIKSILLSTVTLVAIAGVFALPVSAEKPEKDEVVEKKVLICHRDNNAKQPYGPKRIEVAESAVDGTGKGDHFEEHVGPIASTESEAEQMKKDKIEWGDIIPPIEGVHGGLNWDAEGQAIWNNDCQFVTPGQGGNTPTIPTVPTTPTTPTTPVVPGSGSVPTPVIPAAEVEALPVTSGDRTFAYTLIAAGLATVVTGIVIGINALYRRSV